MFSSKSMLLRMVLCLEILLIVTANSGKQRYCGPFLTESLSHFCRSKYASPISNTDKSSDDSDDNGYVNDEPLAVSSPFTYESMPLLANFESAKDLRPRERREFWFLRRGVSDECCLKPCTVEQLKRYCGN